MSKVDLSKLKQLSLINPKGAARTLRDERQIIDALRSHLCDNFRCLTPDMLLNFEVIKFIAVSIEVMGIKQGAAYKISKMDILVKLLKEIYPQELTEEREKIIRDFVQFLHDNGYLAVSTGIKLAKASVMNFIFQKKD